MEAMVCSSPIRRRDFSPRIGASHSRSELSVALAAPSAYRGGWLDGLPFQRSPSASFKKETKRIPVEPGGTGCYPKVVRSMRPAGNWARDLNNFQLPLRMGQNGMKAMQANLQIVHLDWSVSR